MAMPPSLNLHACFTPTGPSAISGPNEDKDNYSVGKFFKFIINQMLNTFLLRLLKFKSYFMAANCVLCCR